MTVNVTLTFPETVLERIDRKRGEIKRSTYVIKLLQLTHEGRVLESDGDSRQDDIKKANLKETLQTASKVGPEEQSAKVETKPPGSGIS